MVHRARSVLAIRAFRRLWGVTYLCSIGDWLSLLALTGLVTTLVHDYRLKSFAFAGVVLTQLLPGLLFAPIGGLLADRFDRRKIMVVCDLARCALFVSIGLVGSTVWLFIGNFLVGCFAMMWIPSKDSAIPNLLRRKEQVETANQLGLVMTYGISVVTAAGLYAIINGFGTLFHVQFGHDNLGIAKVIVIFIGALFLTSALLVATRIPELSLRDTAVAKAEDEKKAREKAEEQVDQPGFLAMVKDAGKFVRKTPLVRGLLIGMVGAFAAGGAVIGSANTYVNSLQAGPAAFGLLFLAVFLGLSTGMASAPKLAQRMPRNRLFGIAIVVAGLALAIVALSPHLAVSLIAVAVVGAGAGIAFLTGMTIIGTQIEDSIRGRINAIYQSLMKIILFGSTAVVPALVALVRPKRVEVLGRPMTIDGTRPVLLLAGLLAALFGVIAYRQMDDRRSETIMSDLLAVLRKIPRRRTGLLIAVEGDTVADTSTQAALLADSLRHSGKREILLASDPALDDRRLSTLLSDAALTSSRARALVAAAVRADLVERQIRPALDRGAVVVMERFVDSPLAQLSANAGLDQKELEGLADWATARLRPDMTVLLDRDSSTRPPRAATEQRWAVQHLLTEMASADPDRYVVVDADGAVEDVAERVRLAVQTSLAGRKLPELVAVEPVETS
ncbi:bifunctional MFS transporter/dTMP kinase [Labedaea rhizosphaerae]|uniref:Thymidylate kinase n=1 Tax=Labedaea rhizosphaerae TaxID=598644 RepID=A0A4R6SNG5_LABRH|nr:dTMP kinase [Labedaea rhizosphaerae]TDQ04733.1 dTMP kinase [Labedaea rhizosphaerae]